MRGFVIQLAKLTSCSCVIIVRITITIDGVIVVIIIGGVTITAIVELIVITRAINVDSKERDYSVGSVHSTSCGSRHDRIHPLCFRLWC